MLRMLARLICLVLGSGAGWFVYKNMLGFFDSRISLIGAGIALILVYVLLYFPLLRPIADAATDYLIVLKQRTKKLRTGVGLGDLPNVPSAPKPDTSKCVICGKPGGPVCGRCLKEGGASPLE